MANTLPKDIPLTYRLRIHGLVQGVGFRPMVWRVANASGLHGQVHNDGDGVSIALSATSAQLSAFISALRENCPPLACIDAIEQAPVDIAVPDTGFHITPSDGGAIHTGMVPDAATCPECLRELNDPTDRRYRYPFVNCTHCGPRLSIVRSLPYDRANTAMADFPLCDDCQREYDDPADRRFHAQATACPACGPRIWLSDASGQVIDCDDPIDAAAAQLKDGAIVAIKGIGGFHLACDARNAATVAELRRRKRRPHKPLALMARDLEQIGRYCHVDPQAAAKLTSPAAPIVVLDALDTARLPAAIAPGQRQWGFMLPYSPLHHLLMTALDSPLVLTSGNRSDEPQCIANADALDRLGDIADLFLLHDRPIDHRVDDSVLRPMDDVLQPLRRARGFAPGRMTLPPGFASAPPLIALGGELKNTFCLLQHGQAILSQHLGDLTDARTYQDYRYAVELYLALYEHRPTALAVDAHPDYLSSQYGSAWAARDGLPLVAVQHHHAHIAACMADNLIALDDGPLLGIALDGLGLGADGDLWGGELLLVDYRDCRRIAHLKPVALPGGAQAMREPWRNTLAQLDAAALPTDHVRVLRDKPLEPLRHMIRQDLNSPLSSSTGRLFDAVAAAIGVAPERLSFEGQAAMALEAAAATPATDHRPPYPFGWDGNVIDPAPCWQALLVDIADGAEVATMAARFQAGLAKVLVDAAAEHARALGIDRVALSGGVFQNRSLLRAVRDGLLRRGCQVLAHCQVPANDGGLALGQAVVAAARSIQQRTASCA